MDELTPVALAALFKASGWSGTLGSVAKETAPKPFVWCKYRGEEARRVDVEVCKFHQQSRDPECVGCDFKRRIIRRRLE